MTDGKGVVMTSDVQKANYAENGDNSKSPLIKQSRVLESVVFDEPSVLLYRTVNPYCVLEFSYAYIQLVQTLISTFLS